MSTIYPLSTHHRPIIEANHDAQIAARTSREQSCLRGRPNAIGHNTHGVYPSRIETNGLECAVYLSVSVVSMVQVVPVKMMVMAVSSPGAGV